MQRTYKATVFTAPGHAVPGLMQGRARGLEQLGHRIQMIDLARVDRMAAEQGAVASVRELDTLISGFSPDVFFFYGATALMPWRGPDGRIGAYLERFGKPFVSFITCADLVRPLILNDLAPACRSGRFFIFTYDSFHLEFLRSLGVDNCALLPLAADTAHFRPVPDAESRAALLAAGFPVPEERLPASFIGNRFSASGAPMLKNGLAPSLDLYPWVTGVKTNWMRDLFLRSVSDFPLHVFGHGWARPSLGPAWTLYPFCPFDSLVHAYNYSRVNLNVTSWDMPDSYPTRVFDAMACGALVVTDRRPCADALFSPGSDLVVVDRPADLPEVLRHYLSDETARLAVSTRARETVERRHSWTVRMREALEILKRRGLLA